MSKVIRKFADHEEYIRAAVEGEMDLREDNHKLYNKIYRFYAKEGVTFTGDAEMDYNMIVNYLYEDFFANYWWTTTTGTHCQSAQTKSVHVRNSSWLVVPWWKTPTSSM